LRDKNTELKAVYKIVAKPLGTVLLNEVKNLIKLEFCNAKILHSVQDDKYWCFANVSILKNE